MAGSVLAALSDARLAADAVDHVNAHGTATLQNDRAEGVPFTPPRRTRRSAGGHVAKFDDRPLPRRRRRSEACTLALTVSRGVIPPTIHHMETDADCRIDVVANHARAAKVTAGVSTSLAFGGNDSAVLITAV